MTVRTPSPEDAKAKAAFSSVAGVAAFFDKNDINLLAYVEAGISRGTCLGYHVSQLAAKVGITLKAGEKEYKVLPNSYVDPRRFDNIADVIQVARVKFGEYAPARMVL